MRKIIQRLLLMFWMLNKKKYTLIALKHNLNRENKLFLKNFKRWHYIAEKKNCIKEE